jgi:hypothetical protein
VNPVVSACGRSITTKTASVFTPLSALLLASSLTCPGPRPARSRPHTGQGDDLRRASAGAIPGDADARSEKWAAREVLD